MSRENSRSSFNNILRSLLRLRNRHVDEFWCLVFVFWFCLDNLNGWILSDYRHESLLWSLMVLLHLFWKVDAESKFVGIYSFIVQAETTEATCSCICSAVHPRVTFEGLKVQVGCLNKAFWNVVLFCLIVKILSFWFKFLYWMNVLRGSKSTGSARHAWWEFNAALEWWPVANLKDSTLFRELTTVIE